MREFKNNNSYNENIISFVNNVKTTDGGTHEVGFKTALTRAGNKTLSEVFKDFSEADKIYTNNKKK